MLHYLSCNFNFLISYFKCVCNFFPFYLNNTFQKINVKINKLKKALKKLFLKLIEAQNAI